MCKNKELIPSSLTLPVPIDVGIKLDMAGVRIQGNKLDGVFVDLKKTGKAASLDFKILEVPGQGKVDGSLLMSFWLFLCGRADCDLCRSVG